MEDIRDVLTRWHNSYISNERNENLNRINQFLNHYSISKAYDLLDISDILPIISKEKYNDYLIEKLNGGKSSIMISKSSEIIYLVAFNDLELSQEVGFIIDNFGSEDVNKKLRKCDNKTIKILRKIIDNFMLELELHLPKKE